MHIQSQGSILIEQKVVRSVMEAVQRDSPVVRWLTNHPKGLPLIDVQCWALPLGC